MKLQVKENLRFFESIDLVDENNEIKANIEFHKEDEDSERCYSTYKFAQDLAKAYNAIQS